MTLQVFHYIIQIKRFQKNAIQITFFGYNKDIEWFQLGGD